LVLDLEGALSDFHSDWAALGIKCGDPLEDGRGSSNTTAVFLKGLEENGLEKIVKNMDGIMVRHRRRIGILLFVVRV
jgi:hypothetical protein